MIDIIQTDRDASRGGHYSHVVRGGDYVFVSGQTPRDIDRKVIGTTIVGQTEATMENVRAALLAAGGTLNDVVKVNVYLADLTDATLFNDTYASYFPNTLPARTTVGSVLNGVLVEIDVVAYVPKKETV